MEAEFNEWAYQPITLNPDEIDNPLSVIDHFFDYDRLGGALKLLERWRDHVVIKTFSEDINYFGSPTSLIFFHDLNLKLIDASFLVLKLLSDKKGSAQTTSHTEFNAVWLKLDETERLELFGTLTAFHAAYTLPQYRSELSKWLYEAFRSKELGESLNAKNVIIIYEGLQRLYSALWILQYHHKHEDDIETDDQSQNKELAAHHVYDSGLYELIPDDEVLRMVAADLISSITTKVPSVQAIIYLGVPPQSTGLLHLLVLTANDEPRQALELGTIIEDACRKIAPVVALVHYSRVLFTELERHSPFFHKALSFKIIYLNNGLILPKPEGFDAAASMIKASFKWQRWHSQGKDFLDGAGYYLQNKSYGAALFSMHQCAECLLIALIRGILGYSSQTHNLSRLLTITGMFTADLIKIFDHPSVEPRFKVLKNGYLDVSYRDHFEPDINAIEALYQDMQKLFKITNDVYAKYSSGLDQ